jgi:hypothetical protein
MDEREARGVEELALEAEVAVHAVGRISGDGEVDRGEVNADLMRAARLETHAQERVLAEELEQLELGHGVSGEVGIEGDARRIMAVAPDRRLDPSAARARAPPHERDVLAYDLPPAEHPLEAPVDVVRAGDDQQPRRVAVQPVDDAGPLGLVAARDRVGREPMDERAARVPGRGVDDDARRLVDNEQVLVLVRDSKRDVLRLDDTRTPVRELELHLLPALEAMALRPPRAVDERAALADEPLGRRARADFLERREESIEPLPGRLLGDRDPESARRQPRWSSPPVFLGVASGRRSAAKSAASRIATPVTMNTSARLKAGQ